MDKQFLFFKIFLNTALFFMLFVTVLTLITGDGVVNAAPSVEVTIYHSDGTVEVIEGVDSVKPAQTDYRANTSVVVVKSGGRTYRLYNAEIKVEEMNSEVDVT